MTLARIIPDEEQAVSSAAGIKLLVELLEKSSSNEILALTSDCIARLSHTRAGEIETHFFPVNNEIESSKSSLDIISHWTTNPFAFSRDTETNDVLTSRSNPCSPRQYFLSTIVFFFVEIAAPVG